MKKYLFLCLLLVLVHPCSVSAFLLPTAKLTVKVVDEQGVPVKGAYVTIAFEVPKAPGRGWGSDNLFQKGSTDDKGFFTGDSEGASGVGFSAEKEGYYTSDASYHFKSKSLLNRWEPWNPTIEVALKKKRNPVATYDNHRTSYKLPKLDEPVGFDLEKEDWVVPYGRGLASDFIFTFKIVDRAYSDYECRFTLAFANEHDGIQEYYFDKKDQSFYKWPFQAPTEGFLRNISREKSLLPGNGYKSNEKNNVNYLFRVRTKVDKEGNIIEAKYGKLIGEFGYDPNGQISFRYILNPDGTRNLEEDPKKNLLKKK